MKRIISIILALMMLLSAAAFAEMGMAGQMSREAVFDQAIMNLQYYNQRESIQQAKNMFGNIPGSYNYANYYEIYAQIMLDVLDEHYEDVLDQLEALKELSSYASFEAALQENWLPSCDSISLYAQARQAEAEMRYADARELYSKTDFMDAPERAIALRDYKATPTPAPTPIPTPEPTPTPTPTPVPRQTTNPDDFSYDIYDGECTITRYNGSDTEIVIPAEIEGYPVTTIGSWSNSIEAWDKSLIKVYIPDSVTTIYSYAFYNCDSLTEIFIPDSVVSIGCFAFWNCTSLTEITIPDSVTEIGYLAFDGCTSLTEIYIPDSVVSVGWNPFVRCSNLSRISISPNHPTLETINGVLFDKADKRLICYPSALTMDSYQIPKGITAIDDYAFANCYSLTEIQIPYSVTSIGNFAFGGCRSLTEIHISDGVTSIGEGAFEGCKSLTEIHIPDGVTSIGYITFKGCKSLTEIYIPNSVTSIDNYAFEDCYSLTEIHIPYSVTSIGEGAFADCDSLTIYCKSGSTAEQYAKEHNLKYSLI